MEDKLLELHSRIERVHWWFTGRRAILRAALSRFLAPPARILEVGCGTGGNLEMLGELGEVVGMDSSPLAVERAAESTGLRVVTGSLPGPLPELFPLDAICCFDVLEHIEDDREALRALHPILRPGGLLFVTVPALPWLWSRHDESFGHKRRYLRRDLEELLGRAGYSVRYCSYFCSLLLPLVAPVRLANRLLHVEGGTDFSVPTLGVNRALHAIFAAEARLLFDRSLPLGSSLLAVAERAAPATAQFTR